MVNIFTKHSSPFERISFIFVSLFFSFFRIPRRTITSQSHCATTRRPPIFNTREIPCIFCRQIYFYKTRLVEKNFDIFLPSNDFRLGYQSRETRVQSQKVREGDTILLRENNFTRNHTAARVPGRFPYKSYEVSAEWRHFYWRKEGNAIRAQLPPKSPGRRNTYTFNKLTAPRRVGFHYGGGLQSLDGERRSNPRHAIRTSSALSTNSPIATLVRSTVYAFLTRHSF